jgi:sulfide:quinone oxidoreductase
MEPTMRSERLHVVVAGAGVAGIEAALALRDLAGDRVLIDVLAPQDELYYAPLVVREPFGTIRDKRIALEPLFAHFGIRYRRGFLASVDATARTIKVSGGEDVPFDALVLACGATHAEAVVGALTFPGLGAVDDLQALLDDVSACRVKRIAFALPGGAGWPLPIYELALMTATELEKRHVLGASLVLVTPESDPLGLFGQAASHAVRELLETRGIELVTQTYPLAVGHGGLGIRPGGLLAADRVVALPRVEGAGLAGVPQDGNGFVPVDEHGAVVGLDGVYAAGDVTDFPLKQGGIAAQQALSVAEAIAARAGAPVTPKPFRPVLRGLLLTGGVPNYYLSSELTGGYGASSVVSHDALWWPPAKIASRYLGPALSALSDLPIPKTPEPDVNAAPVEVELSGTTSFPPELLPQPKQERAGQRERDHPRR